ncbi:MAG: GNAT family N-acetyltransferase [Alphaproteobacteria bacterium]|nr:GNAT family N-acetyltransferase [Alphaproteobacteria bacterium]
MTIILRPGTPADAEACGKICYEAFKAVCTSHGFPPDFPSPEAGIGTMTMVLNHPKVFSVVAEVDGRIAGSNFMDERSPVRAIGPITVDPTVQNGGVGRRLMQAVLDRAAERGAAGVRLLQAAFHNRSLSLYSTLGFRTREPVSILQGKPLGLSFPGYTVRPATAADAAACNALCTRVHGFDRGGELGDAIAQKSALVVEHLGRITAYTTGIAFFAHSVGETNRDLMTLLGAAHEFGGPGVLVPTRNHELFTWCLAHGLRVVYQMHLMTTGLYSEPEGAWLPSVMY